MKFLSFILVLLLTINHSILSIGSAIYGYIIFYIIIIFLNNKHHVKINFSIILLILACLTSLFINDINPIFNSYFKLLGFIVMLIFSSDLISNKYLINIRQQFIKDYYKISVFIIIICLIGLYIPIFKSFSVEETAGGYTGIFKNSIFFGAYISIFIILLFYKMINNKKFDILQFLLFIISFYLLILTGARSAIISLIISLFYLLYVKYGIKKVILKYWYYIFSLPILIYLMFKNGFFSVFIKKIEISKELGVNSRNMVWNNRISEFYENPIFGIGFNTVNLDFSKYEFKIDSGSIEPGSSWLFILSSIGILGLLFFLNVINVSFKKINYRTNNFNLIYISLLIFFIIHFIFEGYVFSVGNILVYIFYISLSLISKKNHDFNRQFIHK